MEDKTKENEMVESVPPPIMEDDGGCCCGDDRFEVINRAKKALIEGTNIESSSGEMKVLDDFLFRCWQMGWLKQFERKPFHWTSENETGIVKFACSELKRLEDACQNDEAREMQQMINHDILDLVKIFGEQGHSGFSAGYTLDLFRKLVDWKPASALTGEDDEWMDISYMTRDGKQTEQNKRCAGLFRDNHDNSTAHYIDDVIFSDNGGATWFSSNWMKEKGNYGLKITFPWMPPTEPRKVYIKYTKEVPLGETGDEFVDITDNEEEIKKLRDKWEEMRDKTCKEEERLEI